VILHSGQKSYEYRATVGQFEQRLDPRYFVRVHRSAIVNIDRIQELHPRAPRGLSFAVIAPRTVKGSNEQVNGGTTIKP
jgi:DNA-binding LytR/AlgR family response regulator